MATDWKDLQNLGWEKIEGCVNSKMFYKTPPTNGIQRKVYRTRDLKDSEKQFAHILFPWSIHYAKKKADSTSFGSTIPGDFTTSQMTSVKNE